MGYLALIQWNTIIGGLQLADSALPAGLARDYSIMRALGNGFILTAMLWGAFGAKLIDHKLPAAAVYLGACAVFGLFGVIHSVDPAGGLYWPWTSGSELSLAHRHRLRGFRRAAAGARSGLRSRAASRHRRMGEWVRFDSK